MAHRSSAESDDQIPSKSLDLNSPNPSKDMINMKEEEQQQEQEDPSASKAVVCEEEKMAMEEGAMMEDGVGKERSVEEESGRERLKRHRVEMGGRVWIPDMWGQEDLLKDWIDCTAFDAPLLPTRISTAREALVQECTRANAAGLRIENRC